MEPSTDPLQRPSRVGAPCSRARHLLPLLVLVTTAALVACSSGHSDPSPAHPAAAAGEGSGPEQAADVDGAATAAAGDGETGSISAASVAATTEPEILASIDGDPVTGADVEGRIGSRLAQMDVQYRSQRHQLVKETLDALVRERLLEEEAARRGIGGSELIRSLVDGKVQVTSEEVAAWHQQNQARLGGRSLDQMFPQIEQYLQQVRSEQLISDFVAQLETDRRVSYFLEPFRVELQEGRSPTYGPADAPITIVEFSDFECPFCKGFNTTLERVKSTYDKRVRIVFRQFPLEQVHPHATRAAEAALCAAEQDRFWQMHDLLFAEQDRLELENLKEKAGRLELDQASFDACLDSGKYAEHVQEDLQAGNAAGVSGTPAIFVNGRPLPGGAVPYEKVAEVIDDELQRDAHE
ncbi:MAG: DsbA family protein [Acidobacteriota bacterium]